MTILVTNDDGYTEGLCALLEVAKKIDKKAHAVIPNRQRSAVSNSLTLHKPLRFHRVADSVGELSGTPADCVLFSLFSGEVEPPKLVLSGINFGDNCGMDSLLGSGTLGACWESVLEGIPAIAFSMFRSSRDWRDKTNWGDIPHGHEKIEEIVRMLKPKLDSDSFFSVQLPQKFLDAEIVFNNNLQRLRFKAFIDKRKDPYGTPYFWQHGDFGRYEKGTDISDVRDGKIVISKIGLGAFKNIK
ncbi:MAG: 5'/3'-nucleotidase SurE [Candidatus Micrarchaeota archaeon]